MFDFKDKNTHSIFKDVSLQNELEENGYVIIPFYEPDDIKQLNDFYKQHTQANIHGFQPTTYFQSLEYRLNASSFIKEIAHKYIEQYFTDYQTYMGSFIVKYPDKNSELGVHQDMTLVDESQFMGVNIWSPLCDTNEQNGALFLIPKSHRIFPTYRNATIKNCYDKHYNLIKKYMQPAYIKAGQAIVFDNSILHYSPPNLSKDIRIATNVFTTHKEATITICYHDKAKNQIELFEQQNDFFTTYTQFGNDSNQERPKIGKSIGFRQYNFPDITPNLLEERYGKLKNENWLSKIKDKFFV